MKNDNINTYFGKIFKEVRGTLTTMRDKEKLSRIQGHVDDLIVHFERLHSSSK